jgi:transposase
MWTIFRFEFESGHYCQRWADWLGMKLTYATELTPTDLKQAASLVRTVRQRRCLKVARLLMQKKCSLVQLAARTGVSRSTLYKWLPRLKTSTGLMILLNRTRSGGREPLFHGETLANLKARLTRGDSPKEILYDLNASGVNISLAGVYFWRRKLGLGRQRLVGKQLRPSPKAKPKLQLKLSASIIREIKQLLRGEMGGLSQRSQMRLQGILHVSEGMKTPEILAILRCSRSALYSWVDRFRKLRCDPLRFAQTGNCALSNPKLFLAFARAYGKGEFSKGSDAVRWLARHGCNLKSASVYYWLEACRP